MRGVAEKIANAAPRQQGAEWRAPELSVVIPTLNERSNLESLIAKLDSAMGDIPHELIIVDDESTDGTADLAKQIASRRPDVRCIRRVGRRGLASAVVEGMSASAAPFVAVIDADHQHDESILPRMLAAAREGAEIVVASRFLDEDGAQGAYSSLRHVASRLANRIAQFASGAKLTDPMSGFFLLRRELFDRVAPDLAPDGFKILFDILVSARRRQKFIELREIPYRFRSRLSGESKMNLVVAAQFLGLVFSKFTGGLLPASFLLFSAIGASGVVVHLGVLTLASYWLRWEFTLAQLAATIVAMTTNFILNNHFTYPDQRLAGNRFWIGLLTFYGICSFGTIANISVATWIYAWEPVLYLAGIAGALMSVVFNYAVTRVVTWR
jgi:dolichol-phosphate mannosyltransferase